MFTGIIEEVGYVRNIKSSNVSAEIFISSKKILEDISLGDSVAVNGVCLTVKDFSNDGFSADIMHETLNRSSFKSLKTGHFVNLERAMLANGRFGGHIVSGHIDGTGKIIAIKKDGVASWYKISCDSSILNLIIEKGSIAIDGISLTVADITKNDFSVSIIPHTSSNTVLSNRNIGDIVNLENDCIGKYIKKFLEAPKNNTISREFLSSYGF